VSPSALAGWWWRRRCGIRWPELLPHLGEAMAGGAGKLLEFGAPRSVDLVGVGAPGEFSVAEVEILFLSFCPSVSSSSW